MKTKTKPEQIERFTIETLAAELKKLGIDFMASACGGIDMGADYDCDHPIVPGVNQRLIIGNLDDVLSITFDLVIPSLILDITLKGASVAFAFQGVKESLTPQYDLIAGTLSVGYNHQVNFLAFDISQEQKDNLERMALTKLFAVIENKNALGNANSIFEVYGIGVGLEVKALTRIPGDQETNGAFSIQLATPEAEGKEPKMPQSWFDTDYVTTLAKVDALLV